MLKKIFIFTTMLLMTHAANAVHEHDVHWGRQPPKGPPKAPKAAANSGPIYDHILAYNGNSMKLSALQEAFRITHREPSYENLKEIAAILVVVNYNMQDPFVHDAINKAIWVCVNEKKYWDSTVAMMDFFSQYWYRGRSTIEATLLVKEAIAMVWKHQVIKGYDYDYEGLSRQLDSNTWRKACMTLGNVIDAAFSCGLNAVAGHVFKNLGGRMFEWYRANGLRHGFHAME